MTGKNVVGSDGLSPGRFHLRKAPPDSCSWSITAPDGSTVARGGSAEGQSGIVLSRNQALITDNCGIWEKTE